MSKIYLQEKITPVAGKYLVIGQDGNVTAGDLPTGTFPTLTVKVPSGATNVSVVQGVVRLPLTQTSSSTWVCNPSSFGIWRASCNFEGSILTDTINIAEIKSYVIDISTAIRSILNDNSWDVIQRVAQQSLGSSYWSIGDKKQVNLNGTIGYRCTIDNFSGYVFIVDFDHNSALEGIGITFQGFQDLENRNIAFYITPSSGSGYSDGPTWKDGNLRNKYFTQDKDNPTSGNLMSCLSDDLRIVLKSTVKYSWNNLDDTTSTGISATTDYLFIPSLYEIFASNQIKALDNSEDPWYTINSNEANYCTRYSYYSNINITYQNNDPENDIIATTNVDKLKVYKSDNISGTHPFTGVASRTGLMIVRDNPNAWGNYENAAQRTWGCNDDGTLAQFGSLSYLANPNVDYWYFSYIPPVMFVIG